MVNASFVDHGLQVADYNDSHNYLRTKFRGFGDFEASSRLETLGLRYFGERHKILEILMVEA